MPKTKEIPTLKCPICAIKGNTHRTWTETKLLEHLMGNVGFNALTSKHCLAADTVKQHVEYAKRMVIASES